MVVCGGSVHTCLCTYILAYVGAGGRTRWITQIICLLRRFVKDDSLML